MGIMDIFNASKIKKENERLLAELESAKKLLTPEMMDACNLEKHIQELQDKETAVNNNFIRKAVARTSPSTALSTMFMPPPR